MNQTKLARWIEEAEARSVCELAKAEPVLFKLAAAPSAAYQIAREMRKDGFLGRLKHRRGPVKGVRPAA